MKASLLLEQLDTLAHRTGLTRISLRRWSIVLAVLYALEGAALWLFGVFYYVPVVATFLTTNSLLTKLTKQVVAAPAIHQLFLANILYFVTAVLLLAAFFQLLRATYYHTQYEKHLAKGNEPLRWVECGVLGSIVLVTLSLLVGLQDVVVLLLLVCSHAVACFAGFGLEQFDTKGKVLTGQVYAIVGSIAGLAPWLAIGWTLLSDNIFGFGQTQQYVWWLIAVTFVLFGCFAVIIYVSAAKKLRRSRYYLVNACYMGLGFITPTAFAWIVFAGVLSHG